MDEAAFRAAVGAMSSLDFCRRHLFDPSAWIFTAHSGVNALGTYQDFRIAVSDAVDTNPNNVSIVGSGKYGFSMAPAKGLRPFNPAQSDIDVVIVSPELFDTAWSDIRTAIYNGYSHLKAMHRNEIIMRFIVLSSVASYNTTYLRSTALAVHELAKQLNLKTRIQNPFKFRVYASWHDVELYHLNGVSELKEAL